MSLTQLRVSKIDELTLLAKTEKEKNIVIKAGMEICDAESDEKALEIANKYFAELKKCKSNESE